MNNLQQIRTELMSMMIEHATNNFELYKDIERVIEIVDLEINNRELIKENILELLNK